MLPTTAYALLKYIFIEAFTTRFYHAIRFCQFLPLQFDLQIILIIWIVAVFLMSHKWLEKRVRIWIRLNNLPHHHPKRRSVHDPQSHRVARVSVYWQHSIPTPHRSVHHEQKVGSLTLIFPKTIPIVRYVHYIPSALYSYPYSPIRCVCHPGSRSQPKPNTHAPQVSEEACSCGHAGPSRR